MVNFWKACSLFSCLSVFFLNTAFTSGNAQPLDQAFLDQIEAKASADAESSESISEENLDQLIEEAGSSEDWQVAAPSALPACWYEKKCGTQFAGWCGSGLRKVSHYYRCCATAAGTKKCSFSYTTCGC